MKNFYHLAMMLIVTIILIGTALPVSAGEHKMTASGLSDDDKFGTAVAISGDYTVVGAPGDDDNGSGAGAAFIFARNQGGSNNWGQVGKLTAADGAAGDAFGSAVAISGDYLVIGAPGDDDNGSASGTAFIFARGQGDSWSQIKKLKADQGNDEDGFGTATAISGDRIIVGMPYDDDNGTDAGAALIFARNQGSSDNWGQEAKISVATLFNLESAENFGLTVAIDGDNAVVGAPGTDDGGIDSGLAYLFNRNHEGTNAWGKVADLAASDGAAFYEFATAVGISGEFVLVGSPHDNNPNGSSAGAVFIYQKNNGGTNSWGELKKLTSDDGIALDYFGTSVGIAGDYAVVGAKGHDTLGPRTANGAAYILERNEGGSNNWGIREKLTASDANNFDFFGASAAISGNRDALIGVPEQNDMTGAAYLFDNAAKPPVASGVYFSHVASLNGWETEIALINTGEITVSGQLISYNDDGNQVGTMPITLNSMARRQITVGAELSNPSQIGFIVFATEANSITGYTKFSHQDSGYRVAVPAVTEVNNGPIYISHIASDTDWWTGISLVNTTTETKNLTIQFDDGSSKNINMDAGTHEVFSIAQLFGNIPQTGIHSAIITNADGIIGLELFGTTGTPPLQLSGILLKDELTTTIIYPHIASDDGWWTGIVAYDPSAVNDHFTVTPYQEDGTALTAINVPLDYGQKKYVGSATSLGLPAGTDWLKIEAVSGITGFELFGTNKQLGGYTGVGISAADGVFPKIDHLGWTGIAFVNPNAVSVDVTLVARRDDGTAVTTIVKNLIAGKKIVDPIADLFPGCETLDQATFVTYSATGEIVGFQLNGSADNSMLDALPAGN